MVIEINPITEDFDLPKLKWLKGLFWFFLFDKERHIYRNFQLWHNVTKKVLFTLARHPDDKFQQISGFLRIFKSSRSSSKICQKF
jgi:hypothetical protein